ncbi:hypothetical protein YC2023_000996 [Brassica napus]
MSCILLVGGAKSSMEKKRSSAAIRNSLYGNCTTNGAPRESNVASQEKYIPGNYKITCFLMVATYTALHQKNHFIRLYMPFLGFQALVERLCFHNSNRSINGSSRITWNHPAKAKVLTAQGDYQNLQTRFDMGIGENQQANPEAFQGDSEVKANHSSCVYLRRVYPQNQYEWWKLERTKPTFQLF